VKPDFYKDMDRAMFEAQYQNRPLPAEYCEREAAIRYVMTRLAGFLVTNPAVKTHFELMRRHRGYQITDALCDCIKMLAEQNAKFLEEDKQKIREQLEEFHAGKTV
jgi:hypothetical protein